MPSCSLAVSWARQQKQNRKVRGVQQRTNLVESESPLKATLHAQPAEQNLTATSGMSFAHAADIPVLLNPAFEGSEQLRAQRFLGGTYKLQLNPTRCLKLSYLGHPKYE